MNTIQNIASLALYNSKKAVYPSIWAEYLKNKWNFEDLFGNILHINDNINSLNPDIGKYTSQSYIINGVDNNIAKIYEYLSIQISMVPFNSTSFVSTIVY